MNVDQSNSFDQNPQAFRAEFSHWAVGVKSQESAFSRCFLGVRPNIRNIIGRWRETGKATFAPPWPVKSRLAGGLVRRTLKRLFYLMAAMGSGARHVGGSVGLVKLLPMSLATFEEHAKISEPLIALL